MAHGRAHSGDLRDRGRGRFPQAQAQVIAELAAESVWWWRPAAARCSTENRAVSGRAASSSSVRAAAPALRAHAPRPQPAAVAGGRSAGASSGLMPCAIRCTRGGRSGRRGRRGRLASHGETDRTRGTQPMRSLTVSLGARAYPIHIGGGLLRPGRADRRASAARRARPSSTMRRWRRCIWSSWPRRCAAGVKLTEIVLPRRRAVQELGNPEPHLRHAAGRTLRPHDHRHRPGRRRHRRLSGLRCGLLPARRCSSRCRTTLLAQVDSSVGGKTGIKPSARQRTIGAFWQPQLVLADTDTLTTLPPRELAAGLGEVISTV